MLHPTRLNLGRASTSGQASLLLCATAPGWRRGRGRRRREWRVQLVSPITLQMSTCQIYQGTHHPMQDKYWHWKELIEDIISHWIKVNVLSIFSSLCLFCFLWSLVIGEHCTYQVNCLLSKAFKLPNNENRQFLLLLWLLLVTKNPGPFSHYCISQMWIINLIGFRLHVKSWCSW